MNEELNKTFNEEVTRYKNALVFYARKCDWETFKVNAGRLFDYIESIERSEIERRFFRVSRIILIVLFFVTVFICRINPEIYPELMKVKKTIILMAISGCGFELYFFMNFRIYMKQKMIYYKKRRDRFIRGIEKDFRESFAATSVDAVAATAVDTVAA
ncbi:MAG: hypothetical protein HZA14_10600 [Nitrospirae bacterium]|nr:hypothetical protein [Nitrospirota bacterium]